MGLSNSQAANEPVQDYVSPCIKIVQLNESGGESAILTGMLTDESSPYFGQTKHFLEKMGFLNSIQSSQIFGSAFRKVTGVFLNPVRSISEASSAGDASFIIKSEALVAESLHAILYDRPEKTLQMTEMWLQIMAEVHPDGQRPYLRVVFSKDQSQRLVQEVDKAIRQVLYERYQQSKSFFQNLPKQGEQLVRRLYVSSQNKLSVEPIPPRDYLTLEMRKMEDEMAETTAVSFGVGTMGVLTLVGSILDSVLHLAPHQRLSGMMGICLTGIVVGLWQFYAPSSPAASVAKPVEPLLTERDKMKTQLTLPRGMSFSEVLPEGVNLNDVENTLKWSELFPYISDEERIANYLKDSEKIVYQNTKLSQVFESASPIRDAMKDIETNKRDIYLLAAFMGLHEKLLLSQLYNLFPNVDLDTSDSDPFFAIRERAIALMEEISTAEGEIENQSEKINEVVYVLKLLGYGPVKEVDQLHQNILSFRDLIAMLREESNAKERELQKNIRESHSSSNLKFLQSLDQIQFLKAIIFSEKINELLKAIQALKPLVDKQNLVHEQRKKSLTSSSISDRYSHMLIDSMLGYLEAGDLDRGVSYFPNAIKFFKSSNYL